MDDDINFTKDEIRWMCEQVGGQRAMARAIGCDDRMVRRWCSQSNTTLPLPENMDKMRDAVRRAQEQEHTDGH